MVKRLFVVLSMAVATASWASDSIIRLKCDSSSEGADIYLNGELKGQCPIDLFVEAGPALIEAVKAVDENYERRWSSKENVVAGVPLRLFVELSSPQLTKEAAARKARGEFQSAKLKALENSLDDMFLLADYYAKGHGTDAAAALAAEWRGKAEAEREKRRAAAEAARLAEEKERFDAAMASAKRGNFIGMEKLAQFYAKGEGVTADAAESTRWKEKADVARLEKEAETGDIEAMEALIAKNNERSAYWTEQLAKTREEIELEEKRADLQRQINAIRFGRVMDKTMPKEQFMNTTGNKTLDEFIFVLGTGIPSMFTGLTGDVIVYPFDVTKKKSLQKKLDATYASSWGNPDSMVAKSVADEPQQKTVPIAWSDTGEVTAVKIVVDK